MNVQTWMSQRFFLFFMAWGIFLPYWTGYLVDGKQLSVEDASIIMSIGLVMRGISTITLYPFLKKTWSDVKVLRWMTSISLLLACSYIVSDGFSVLLIITALFNFFFPMLMPALDAAASSLAQHEQLKYAKARSYGSFGFIVMVLIVSMLSGVFGDQLFLLAIIVVLALLTALMWQKAPQTVTLAPDNQRHGENSFKQLFQTKYFFSVLLLAILLQGAHAAYYNYGYLYLQYLGVSKLYIGMIINVSIIFEILLFMKADKWFYKWQPMQLFLLAAIGSTCRWILIFSVPTVSAFIASQVLHSLSFALAHYAFMRFITKALPTQLLPSAQGLYATFAQSFATAAMTFFSAYLYHFSIQASFLGMIVFTIPAAIIAFYISRKQMSAT